MNNSQITEGRLPDITFFVPCYNEEANISATLETVLAAVSKTKLRYEIMVVDDCSRDGTSAVVSDFQKTHPEVPLILQKNQVNLGLGRNYIDAAFRGHGAYFMLINGDNAETEGAVVAILSELGKADMIIPYFGAHDQRGRRRRVLSRLFTRLVNLFSGYHIRYYNGPVLHRRYNIMRWHPDTHGYAYQAETITRLLDENATFIEVEVDNIVRRAGVTKAFRIQNVLSIAHSLLQIFLRRLRRLFFARSY